MTFKSPVIVRILDEHLAQALGWDGCKIGAVWIDPMCPGVTYIRFEDAMDVKHQRSAGASAEFWYWYPESKRPEPPGVA